MRGLLVTSAALKCELQATLSSYHPLTVVASYSIYNSKLNVLGIQHGNSSTLAKRHSEPSLNWAMDVDLRCQDRGGWNPMVLSSMLSGTTVGDSDTTHDLQSRSQPVSTDRCGAHDQSPRGVGRSRQARSILSLFFGLGCRSPWPSRECLIPNLLPSLHVKASRRSNDFKA